MREERVWGEPDGFPNYRVSSDGIIQNIKTGRILKQSKNNSGYPTVNMYNDGHRKTNSVHRWVAETFVDGDFEGAEVNHKNGSKVANHVNNLEFCTRGDNARHAYKTGLKYGPKHKPVEIIETGEVYPSVKECARAIGGHDRNITRCLRGESKTCYGLTFRYANDEDINTREFNECKALNVGKRRPYKRPVRIVETGEVFDSLHDCARAVGGDVPGICGCLSGRHKTHRNYHYEYVD